MRQTTRRLLTVVKPGNLVVTAAFQKDASERSYLSPLGGKHIRGQLQQSYGEGDGTLLQYSCLENPMDGGAWQAAVHGVAGSQT